MKTLNRTTRSVGLVLLAVVVTACGSSGSTGGASNLGSGGKSPQAPNSTADLIPYQKDSGGITGADDIAQAAGYTPRYEGDAIYDRLNGGFKIIEQGMPAAQDTGAVVTGEAGAIGSETAILWQPNGRRDTMLPATPHGERIYTVVVILDGYIQGGDATARISFVSRTQGDALNPKDPAATPVGSPPDQIYTYKIDKATAAALLDYFFVKGAPVASPTEAPTEAPAES